MDEKTLRLHKKEWEYSRKKYPDLFNVNFDKHMRKIEQRDKDRRKAEWLEGKHTINVSRSTWEMINA